MHSLSQPLGFALVMLSLAYFTVIEHDNAVDMELRDRVSLYAQKRSSKPRSAYRGICFDKIGKA